MPFLVQGFTGTAAVLVKLILLWLSTYVVYPQAKIKIPKYIEQVNQVMPTLTLTT